MLWILPSTAPIGYRRTRVKDGLRDRWTLEPDPVSASVISNMFRMANDGNGLKEVCHALNDDGLAAPHGRPWTKTAAHRVLTNEVYTGTLVWGRASKDSASAPVRVEGAWPALVDRQTFDAVQARLRSRAFITSHPRRTASRYLLSGLLRCSACGQGFGGQLSKSGRFAYYVCGTLLKRGRGTCPSPYLNARHMEEMVLAKIRDQILVKDVLKQLDTLVNEDLAIMSSQRKEDVATSNQELAEVNSRLERLYDALETGKLSLDDIHPRIQQLRQRQQHIQATQADKGRSVNEREAGQVRLEDVLEHVNDMHALLEQGTIGEQRTLLRSFVQEIVVCQDEAAIKYTLPLVTGWPKEHKVPAIVTDGTPGRTRTADPRFRKPLLYPLSYRGAYLNLLVPDSFALV